MAKPKRYKRQEEDEEMLRLLKEYRFLSTEQLIALLGPRRKIIRNPEYREVVELRGMRATQRRLGYLFQHKMTTRPPMQRHYLRTGPDMVHGLLIV